jgi:hypothetical protein
MGCHHLRGGTPPTSHSEGQFFFKLISEPLNYTSRGSDIDSNSFVFVTSLILIRFLII